MGAQWDSKNKAGAMGKSKRNGKPHQDKIRKLRQKLILGTVVGLALVLGGLIILSQPIIQEAYFHPWLIKRWKVIASIVALASIAIAATLPVIIEANYKTRVLSGPGDNPYLR
jgi:hypothetical protein